MNSAVFSPRSSSRVSLQDLSICACCGKPRKSSIESTDLVKIPLHAEQIKRTWRGSMYSEIRVPNYGNGTANASSAASTSGHSQIRRSSVQRDRARHSSTHSFISLNGSVAPTPPGLDYGYGSLSDSGPVSPISRDGSVDVGPRGRRSSNPRLVGVNGAGVVSSPASVHSMDQMIWQTGQEQGSGSDASDESEVKKGKKIASADSDTLGAAILGHHQATPLPPMQCEQSNVVDMIGRRKRSGYGYGYGVEPAREAIELPA